MGKRAGPVSYWEQARQDRGYRDSHTYRDGHGVEGKEKEVERDSMAGPFPVQAEGGGESVLHAIKAGGVARRFGGTLTAPAKTTPTLNHSSNVEELPTEPRGTGLEKAQPDQQYRRQYTPNTSPPGKVKSQSAYESSSTSGHTHGSNLDLTTISNKALTVFLSNRNIQKPNLSRPCLKLLPAPLMELAA